MKREWFVVAAKPGVKIYERAGREAELRFVEGRINPLGVMKNREITTDRNGRRAESGGPTGMSSLGASEEPREREVERFVSDLSAHLWRKYSAGEFDQLTIVAEPRLLGLLRKNLHTHPEFREVNEIPKNVFHMAHQDIGRHLSV